MSRNYDDVCLAIIARNPSMMIPWYMMAAYGYYIDNQAILSDTLFDKMAWMMLERWDELAHFHKHWITQDDLEAGTLLLRDFPKRVVTAYYFLIKEGESSDRLPNGSGL